MAIRSRMIWLARKVITRRGAIGTSTPVFGIAADALALVAQDERAEAGNLHVLALGQRVAHVVQHALDDARGFGARQAELAMDDIGQVGARQRAVGVRFLVTRAIPRSAIHFSRPVDGAPRRSIHVRNGIPPCRQFDIRRIANVFQYLSAAAPQVNPPPIASSTTRSPRLIRPSLTAVSSASGTDAADVLACSVDGDHHFFRRKAELPRGRVEDSRIGLVRHDPVDVGGGQARRVEHFVEHARRG